MRPHPQVNVVVDSAPIATMSKELTYDLDTWHIYFDWVPTEGMAGKPEMNE